jgi:hypothetical protein
MQDRTTIAFARLIERDSAAPATDLSVCGRYCYARDSSSWAKTCFTASGRDSSQGRTAPAVWNAVLRA